MKIKRIAIEGQLPALTETYAAGAISQQAAALPAAGPVSSTIEFGSLSPGLNVGSADSLTTPISALAGLLVHAVYGLSYPGLAAADGSLDVETQSGSYRLRRRSHGDPGMRLTIAALNGQSQGPGTLDQLLGGISPRMRAEVFVNPGRDAHSVQSLLAEPIARELQEFEQRYPLANKSNAPASDFELTRRERLDRRDLLAEQVEQALADRRRQSECVEIELRQLEGILGALRADRAARQQKLHSLDAEKAELESRLRYDAISRDVEHSSSLAEEADWRPRLDELDGQIERWRITLADLEHRESVVRAELSRVHPDDSSPALPLADQRAGLAVARRLVDDLESEVARLARAAGSELCLCNDAHPRLNPLVETLSLQVNRLVELSQQQSRALRLQQLTIEAEDLSRSQADLRRQLDHLLDQRQVHWRSTRAREAATYDRPDDAGQDRDSEASLLFELNQRRNTLAEELSELDARIAHSDQQRTALVARRSATLHDRHVEQLQNELTDLQCQIDGDHLPAATTALQAPWRASELFAKLTDGRFNGLQLVSGGRDFTALTRHGEDLPSGSLSALDARLAALSFALAIASSYNARGVSLPIVFEEPFEGMDDRHAAILANILQDFAQRGQQVFVFTTRNVALNRFHAVGVHRLSAARSTAAKPAPAPPSYATERHTTTVEVPKVEQRVETRVDRNESEYLLEPEDSIERFPVAIANRSELFARSRIRTIGDLLSGDPSAIAEELDREDISAALVSLWQSHLGLVCFVPGLSLDDAVALTGAGVIDPQELADSDEGDLLRRIESYFQTKTGARLYERGYRVNASHAARWRERARRGVTRWQSSSTWNSWRRHLRERQDRLAGRERGARSDWTRDRSNEVRESDSSRQDRRLPRTDRDYSSESNERESKSKRETKRESRRRTRPENERSRRVSAERSAPVKKKLRFHLETDSDVEKAPSIGQKTADKLYKMGIHTVADLLAADPETVANKLDSKRVTAETIVAWQHQAQLVCRIPEIRGHDAQIMVACGFTTPEDVSAMKPAEMLEFVEPFCSTTEGERILRNGKAPDLDEVSDWITWARNCRTLEVA